MRKRARETRQGSEEEREGGIRCHRRNGIILVLGEVLDDEYGK